MKITEQLLNKLVLPLSRIFVASTLFLIALIGNSIYPAGAQGIRNSGIANSLISPNSSQRFFNRGRDLFDIEIRRLQRESQTPLPVLQVNPNILQQQQIWQEQQQHLLEEMWERSDRTP